jgi:hypothetical protein
MSGEHLESERDQRFSEVLITCVEAVDNNNIHDLQRLLAAYHEFAAAVNRFLEGQQQLERLTAPLRCLTKEVVAAGKLDGEVDANSNPAVPQQPAPLLI